MDQTVGARAGMPRWLGILSILTLFLCVYMLATFVSLSTSYEFVLLWTFLLFVSLLHCGLCYWKSIRKKHIRFAEYTYLLLAAAGVFLGLASAQKDRQELIFVVKESVPITQDAMNRLLAQNNTLCSQAFHEEVVRRLGWSGKWLIKLYLPSENYCHWIDEVSPTLMVTTLSQQQVSKIIENAYRVADEEGFFSIADFSPISLFDNVFNGKLGTERILGPATVLAIESYLVRTYPSYIQEKQHEFKLHSHDIVWSAMRNYLWPIILAFAIALRITKVTSDFFSWPK